MSAAEIAALVAASVTLNGAAACIWRPPGKLRYVRTFDGKGAAEFSWPAVARIVASGGRFKS